MGKYSDFERKPRDFYRTPPEAVLPLVPFLDADLKYAEPCAGDNALIDALEFYGISFVEALDIAPRAGLMRQADALQWEPEQSVDMIITNPPWSRDVLHPMIAHFSDMRPTWLLFDADWMHTRQSAQLIKRCRMIVSVGRVKWFPDSKMTGKENCAWYLFDHRIGPTEFIGRCA